MSPFERLERCIQRQETDRAPVAFWRHFPQQDQHIGAFVQATLNWQRRYEFDFVKVMPGATYCLYDWGCRTAPEANQYGVRPINCYPITSPQGWYQLAQQDLSSGQLAQHLSALRHLQQHFCGSIPLMATVFSPLSQALNLAGQEGLNSHIEAAPEAVLAGLNTIARSTEAFVKNLVKLGLTGLYWVEKRADLSQALRPFVTDADQRVLGAAAAFRFNLLHVHHGACDLNYYRQLPLHALSHHGLYDPAVYQRLQKDFPGALCGGLRRDVEMAAGNTHTVAAACKHLLEAHKTGFILGADCGLRMDVPHESLMEVIRTVKGGAAKVQRGSSEH